MGLRVYGAAMSQPSRLVLWTCALLKVPFEFKPLVVDKGEHTSQEMIARNPNAKFPVLEEDTAEGEPFVLWESHAIAKYLASRFDADGSKALAHGVDLIPSNARLRARSNAWLDWKHSNLRVGAAGIVRRRVMVKIMKDYSKHSMRWDLVEIPEEREVRILLESLKIMEEQLKLAPFITGSDKPTLADIALATEVEQLAVMPGEQAPPNGSLMADSFPAIDAWMGQMRNIEGFAESHKGFAKIKKVIDKMRAKSKL